MHTHLDAVVSARERLVDGVVDDLVDEVMEPSRTGRADVHARPFADRLQALQDLDVLGGVAGGLGAGGQGGIGPRLMALRQR